ncbi:hypothetical protein KP509_12G038600 [Ceratopteris richardii]|uniref:4-coumarate--CoA ligase n=1 Tax=Ceratopteris richardii TaxID=49495 RepID=A0A8T2TK99_CERRI|nr:hypothetical protein KP509_12G038600 [Ceratopteris richardii]
MASPHEEPADTSLSSTDDAYSASGAHKLDSCEAISNGANTYFRSKLPDISIPDHLPVAKYCMERAHDIADKPCLLQNTEGEKSFYTYGEVEISARRIASGLLNMGIKKGDTIMLLLPNSVEFVLFFMGAAMAGVVITTCNPFFTKNEIGKQIYGSSAKLIITQEANAEKVSNAVDGRSDVKIVLVDGKRADGLGGDAVSGVHLHAVELLNASLDGFQEVEISPEDLVVLPYSSGTTGLPKGVMHTHRGLVTSIAQQVEGQNPNVWFREEDVVLCLLPMFHIYSMHILLSSLRVGASVVLMEKFEVGSLLEVIERRKVTIAPLVPPIVVSLAKSPLLTSYDLSSIRFLMCGAASLSRDLEEAFRARIPHAIMAQGYGMTEAFLLSVSLDFAKHPFPSKKGSCGTVVRNAMMKIVDPETAACLPRNHPGEICIKGNEIMKGYINDDEATRNAIDAQGFLHTGDIGFVDDDEEIFIVGRAKEIIKYKGFQVSPAELENILMSHTSITDAGCVPKMDTYAGEIPVAFVVTAKGATITEDEIKEFVATQVVYYKKIHNVYFVEQIPKSPSGKILRKELIKALETQNSVI